MTTSYRVGKTRIGQGSKAGSVRFVVDFLTSPGPGNGRLDQVASITKGDLPFALPEATVGASAGQLGKTVVQPNPYSSGIRVVFEFDPQDQKESDLRLALASGRDVISEVWLFRWSL